MKKYLHTVLILFCSIQLIAQYETFPIELDIDGITREMDVYLPSTYQQGDVLPLVINMHGFGSNSFQQNFYSGFNDVAEEHNFIVIYPQGLVDTTGFGSIDTHWAAYFGTDTDDMSFMHTIIDWSYTFHNIDLSRVYATGMSNGGFMSYRLACEMSERVAAIASVTGSMAFEQFDNCSPSRPVPIMEIHGTADLTVPYNGAFGFIPPIPEIIDFWAMHNQCGQPVLSDFPDINTDDMSTVSATSYTDCQDDTEVLLYTVENGGHSWPGAYVFPEFGATNLDINASQHIWEFFTRHSHPDPAPAETLNTSTETIYTNELVVTPNPFDDFIQIKTAGSGKASIIDMNGKLLLQKEISSTDFQLQTTRLTAGMYLLRIQDEIGNQQTFKMVKY